MISIFFFAYKQIKTINIVEISKLALGKELSQFYFMAYCDKTSVNCKKCGSCYQNWKRDKEQYESKKSKYRATLRIGTVLDV